MDNKFLILDSDFFCERLVSFLFEYWKLPTESPRFNRRVKDGFVRGISFVRSSSGQDYGRSTVEVSDGEDSHCVNHENER